MKLGRLNFPLQQHTCSWLIKMSAYSELLGNNRILMNVLVLCATCSIVTHPLLLFGSREKLSSEIKCVIKWQDSVDDGAFLPAFLNDSMISDLVSWIVEITVSVNYFRGGTLYLCSKVHSIAQKLWFWDWIQTQILGNKSCDGVWIFCFNLSELRGSFDNRVLDGPPVCSRVFFSSTCNVVFHVCFVSKIY